MFFPHPRVKVSIVGSLRDREVAFSASDRQGSNFESCVWRTVSSQSSHHPQEVLLSQFSLYVHKGGLKPDSFHFKTTNVMNHNKLSNFVTALLWNNLPIQRIQELIDGGGRRFFQEFMLTTAGKGSEGFRGQPPPPPEKLKSKASNNTF